MNKKNNVISLVKGTEVEQIPYGSPVKGTIGLPLDLEHPDRTWERYGVLTYKLFLQTEYGKVYDDNSLKSITKNGYNLAVVSGKYLVIPHDPIDEMVDAFLKDKSNKLRLLDTKISFHGRNKYWLLIGDEDLVLRNSHVPDDRIKLGVAIRNSIGGRLAFGVDLFTYRWICQNGAIFGYKDFGSYSLRHFGTDVERMQREVFEAINDSLGRGAEIMNYYKKFAAKTIGNNTEMFEELAAHNISQKYLPEYIQFVRPNKSKGQERKAVIPSSARNKTYWEVFNDITREIWHEKNLAFDATRYFTKKLHDVMIEQVLKN